MPLRREATHEQEVRRENIRTEIRDSKSEKHDVSSEARRSGAKNPKKMKKRYT